MSDEEERGRVLEALRVVLRPLGFDPPGETSMAELIGILLAFAEVATLNKLDRVELHLLDHGYQAGLLVHTDGDGRAATDLGLRCLVDRLNRTALELLEVVADPDGTVDTFRDIAAPAILAAAGILEAVRDSDSDDEEGTRGKLDVVERNLEISGSALAMLRKK